MPTLAMTLKPLSTLMVLNSSQTRPENLKKLPVFTMLTDSDNVGNTGNTNNANKTGNADNAESTDNADNLYNTDILENKYLFCKVKTLVQ